MFLSRHLIAAFLAVASSAACLAEGVAPTEAGIAVKVAPIGLTGAISATYHIEAWNRLEVLAWTEDVTVPLDANGAGQVVFSGPCVAADGPYRVALTLVAVYDANGLVSPSRYIDPTATAPLEVSTTCPETGQAQVSFDVTVLGVRREFDVDVTIDEIFCSAKFDCVGEDQGPIPMLFDPRTGLRGSTVILAFACTAGANQPTTLRMNDLRVVCDDEQTYDIAPMGPDPTNDGNGGPAWPLFFASAQYRGIESLPAFEKCFWSVALGVAPEAAANTRCHLEASATATAGPLPTDPSALVVYPYIHWSIDLVDHGQIACGRNPLGTVGSGTRPEYLTLTDQSFEHAFVCSPPEQ